MCGSVLLNAVYLLSDCIFLHRRASQAPIILLLLLICTYIFGVCFSLTSVGGSALSAGADGRIG